MACHCEELERRIAALEAKFEDAIRNPVAPKQPQSQQSQQPGPVPVMGIPKSGVALEDTIEQLAKQILGRCEEKKLFQKQIRELGKEHGRDAVTNAFRSWAESQGRWIYAKPVAMFLKQYRWDLPVVRSNNLDKILDEIAYISDNHVIFSPNQKPAIAAMVNEFGHEPVVRGFKEFWSKANTDERPWVAKNFAEKGATFVRTLVRQTEEAAELNAALLEAREKDKAAIAALILKKEAELLAESQIDEEL